MRSLFAHPIERPRAIVQTKLVNRILVADRFLERILDPASIDENVAFRFMAFFIALSSAGIITYSARVYLAPER